MSNERKALIATAVTVAKTFVCVVAAVIILNKLFTSTTPAELFVVGVLIMLAVSLYTVIGIVYDTHLDRIKKESRK